MTAITITQITPSELELLIENCVKKAVSTLSNDISRGGEPHLLTIKQAADFLTLSVPTLYGLVSQLKIPVSKRGKRLYFSRQELSEWIKEGRKKTQAEIEAEASSYLSSKVKRG
jgi:excisionase family DNA binding protein